jgi:drug/metabolite transporter (DMT)-like permease
MNTFSRLSSLEGYGEIIAAAVLWSFAGIFAKMIRGMEAQNIIFYRVAFGFIIIFISLLISGNFAKIRLKDKKRYLLLFSVLQAITMLTFFISILKASVSIAVLLLYTAPVYVTVLSPYILKESSSRKGWAALFLSITGIMLIVNPEKIEFGHHSLGILAGILSGISFALQIMTSKYISASYSGYTQAFWSFLIAIFIFLPAGIVPLDIISGNLVYLVLLAIFPTLLSVSLYFNGLKKVKASNASILGLLEPLSAVILAVLILHEILTGIVLLGGALILTGAALVTHENE